ncbi:response regulator transcription factor [Streptomyces sp. NPDC054802]
MHNVPAPRTPLTDARLTAIRARVARTPTTPEGRALSDLLAEVQGLRRPTTRNPLTSRQTRVVLELARGGQIPEVAERLHLSFHTVKTHLSHARRRTGASTNTQLIALAFANRWLTLHDLAPEGNDQ